MRKITAIEQQKKNKDRVSLYLDGEFFIGLSLYVSEKNKLKVGMEIDQNYIQALVEEDDLEKGKIYALKYCLNKTEHMIRKKLAEKDYSEKVINEIIDFMFRYNYINDEVYARAYTHDAILLKKYGTKRIFQELKNKGVSIEIIDLVLSEVNEKEQVNAAIAKLKNKINDYKRKSNSDYEFKNKCYAFLMRSGFEQNTIQIAISHFIGNKDF